MVDGFLIMFVLYPTVPMYVNTKFKKNHNELAEPET